MSDTDIQRSLRLVRYGGIVITVTVFIVLLAFAVIVGNAISTSTGVGVTGGLFNSLLPYILGFTVLTAILAVVLYFGYRAYLKGKATQ